LGRGALQHLLCIEATAKAARGARLAAERAAAQAAEAAAEASRSGGGGGRSRAAAGVPSADADISAQVGGAAADAALDALAEAAEAESLAQGGPLAGHAALLSALCHRRSLLGMPAALQEAALHALGSLAALDGGFCSQNVALLFTLLVRRLVPPPVRANIVVALADLACRWPNTLEQWTACMYEPLSGAKAAAHGQTAYQM
jgi:condensin complex subunit 1